MKLFPAILALSTISVWAIPPIRLVDDTVASTSIKAACTAFAWPEKPLGNSGNVTLLLDPTTFSNTYGNAANGLAYAFTPMNVSNPTSIIVKRIKGAAGAVANPRFLLAAAKYQLYIKALDSSGGVGTDGSRAYEFTVPRCVVDTKGPARRPDTSGLKFVQRQ